MTVQPYKRQPTIPVNLHDHALFRGMTTIHARGRLGGLSCALSSVLAMSVPRQAFIAPVQPVPHPRPLFVKRGRRAGKLCPMLNAFFLACFRKMGVPWTGRTGRS